MLLNNYSVDMMEKSSAKKKRKKKKYQTIFIVYNSKGQKKKKKVHVSTEGCQHLEIIESTLKTLSPFQPYELQWEG